MSKIQPLLTSYKMGDLLLKNRLVIAPMTRSRANNKENVPTELHVKYYKQRAIAGLIISEGSQISKRAVGYVNTPGIYSEAQVKGWRAVTDAVHKEEGKIFIQLCFNGLTEYLGKFRNNIFYIIHIFLFHFFENTCKISLLFFACSKDKDDVSPDSKGGTKYRVTFDIDWNSTNFPIDYPSGAHFSKLIGWSHDGSRLGSKDIKRAAGLLPPAAPHADSRQA